MVAGDHDGPDARLAAFLDGVVDFRTAGVDHAQAADKDHILFEGLRLEVLRHLEVGPVSGAQHAQGPVGELLADILNLFAVLVGDGNGLAVAPYVVAALQHDLGRTLGILIDAVPFLMDGGHHLAHGVEGRLADAGEVLVQLVFVQF